jgi:hypothetical protein
MKISSFLAEFRSLNEKLWLWDHPAAFLSSSIITKLGTGVMELEDTSISNNLAEARMPKVGMALALPHSTQGAD